MKNQTKLSIALTCLSFGIFLVSTFNSVAKVSAQKEIVACASYGRTSAEIYEKTNALLKEDPQTYARLDRDGDGIACEDYQPKK